MLIEGVAGDAVVPQAFKKALADFGKAAEELEGRFAVSRGEVHQRAAGEEELQHHVGDLQQRVEAFEYAFVVAVGVFEVQAAVLLVVEALVFNFPSAASSGVCECGCGRLFYLEGDRMTVDGGRARAVPAVRSLKRTVNRRARLCR